jgi:hypothetical protein
VIGSFMFVDGGIFSKDAMVFNRYSRAARRLLSIGVFRGRSSYERIYGGDDKIHLTRSSK